MRFSVPSVSGLSGLFLCGARQTARFLPAPRRLLKIPIGEPMGIVFRNTSYCSAYTLTRLRSLPTRSKRTVPSVNANRVSSEPMPTFVPG